MWAQSQHARNVTCTSRRNCPLTSLFGGPSTSHCILPRSQLPRDDADPMRPLVLLGRQRQRDYPRRQWQSLSPQTFGAGSVAGSSSWKFSVNAGCEPSQKWSRAQKGVSFALLCPRRLFLTLHVHHRGRVERVIPREKTGPDHHSH